MKIGKFIGHTLAIGAAFICVGTAQATTVVVSATYGGHTIASGYFSFADTATGVLGYSDLTTFGLDIAGHQYSLADARSYTDYTHFAYDVGSKQLLTGALCGPAGCDYDPDSRVAMVATDLATGFVLFPGGGLTPPQINFLDGNGLNYNEIDNYKVTTFEGVTLAPGDSVVTFVAGDSAGTVAAGFFSYAAGSDGVLGYSDLTTFGLDIAGHQYSLADARSYTDYTHFAYDVGSDKLLKGALCGSAGCDYDPDSAVTMVATDLATGFVLFPGGGLTPPQINFLEDGDLNYNGITSYSTTQFAAAAVADVPEPASWATLVVGFLMGGMGLRRGRAAARARHA